MSLADSNTIGYTDSITIANANSSSSSDVPSSEIPTGTVASVLTIPAPTSTDLGASTPYYGSLPKPTAVTGTVTSASRASASTVSGSESRGTSSTTSERVSGSQTSAAAVSSTQPSSASGAAAGAATSATSSSSRTSVSWLYTSSVILVGAASLALTA